MPFRNEDGHIGWKAIWWLLGATTVSIADPKAMLALVDNADVAPETAERLRRAIGANTNSKEAV